MKPFKSFILQISEDKESVKRQIDEISRKAMGRYVSKAQDRVFKDVSTGDLSKTSDINKRRDIIHKTKQKIAKHDRKHGKPDYKVSKHSSEAFKKKDFSGYQARAHREDGSLAYFGKTVWKSKSHAEGESKAYHAAYDKHHKPGEEKAARKKARMVVKDYTNKNKKHVAAHFRAGTYKSTGE